MSLAENKTLARRYFDEVLNQKRGEVLEDYETPDYTNNLFPPGAPLGPDGERFTLRLFQQAFSDFRVIVEDLVAEDDRVAARWRFTGTHDGPFQGLPATGRQVDVGGMNIFSLRDGKFCANWVSMDMLGMLQQVGAIPAAQEQPAPVGR